VAARLATAQNLPFPFSKEGLKRSKKILPLHKGGIERDSSHYWLNGLNEFGRP